MESKRRRKPGSSTLLCLPISGRRPSRDPVARWPASPHRRDQAGSSHPEKRQLAPEVSSRHGRARSIELRDRQAGVQRHLQREIRGLAASLHAWWDSPWHGSHRPQGEQLWGPPAGKCNSQWDVAAVRSSCRWDRQEGTEGPEGQRSHSVHEETPEKPLSQAQALSCF